MKLVSCDLHSLIFMPVFIYVFNLLFKPFLKLEPTTQVSGQATKNFDLLSLSISLFLVIGFLQPLLDTVMPLYVRSFLQSLSLPFILPFVPERQQRGGNGKWRRKGKQHMQRFFLEFASHRKKCSVHIV